MKSLIYTGATGAGHTLAARSLQQALVERGDEAVIIDGFKEGGKIIDKTITKGYEQLVENWPKLYRKLYSSFDNETRTTETILKNAAKILKRKLLSDIQELKPDIIISTHPIITNILGRIKDEGKIDVPIVAFVTDFVIHDIYIRDSIDAYIVGSEYTKETMLEKNVSEDKIYTYGIPVRKEFRSINTDIKKGEVPQILLMAGSLGSKQLKKAFLALLKTKARFKICIVCGNNKQIRSELIRLRDNLNSDKDIDILGYVENISELMDESALVITKPGGLTSTEAITKHLPIIIAYSYPGVEEYNRDYLVSHGLAVELEEIEDIKREIEQIEANPLILEGIKNNMIAESSHYSIDKTVELCRNLVNHG